ncbi:MAG: ATP-binding protein [Paludibacteraceae bacterium]|nr:ATP-binding protein [Paludibacteraceae bacterium]
MVRYIIEELYRWKQNPARKPLVLQGARQVGKTWLMQQFAHEAFHHHVYINFESNELLRRLFERDFDINRILLEIQVATGETVTSDTLLLFDEIQEAGRGITALKYFCEERPDIPLIAAGSLLGIAMHASDSFPVGKVDFLTLYPMSFPEFLEATGNAQMALLLHSRRWETVNTFLPQLEALLRQYYYVGGMPEAVKCFAEQRDWQRVREVQTAILDSYDRDFSKHAPLQEVPRIRLVWRSIIGQLAKENKKFIYGFLKEGARAKDYEIAVEWLQDAGLIYKVHRTKRAGMPLAAYEDFSAFKVYLSDIGLLGALANLPVQVLLDGNRVFTDFKGALTEQYVMQQLRLRKDRNIYYWSAENSRGEIDFLLQQDDRIIPVEVKAEENLQAKSLRMFVLKNDGMHGVRFSMSPYKEQEWMTNYPLPAVEAALS